MDLMKTFSDKKMKVALGVTIIAFILLVIPALGVFTSPVLLPTTLGSVGEFAIAGVAVWGIIFYGLGYVRKDMKKEEIKFFDARNILIIIAIVVISLPSALVFGQAGLATLIFFELVVFGLVLLFLDHYALKNSIASGINFIFIASIIAGYLYGLLSDIGFGLTFNGSAPIPNFVIAIAPDILTVFLFIGTFYLFKSMKSQTHAVLKLLDGAGKRIPVPYLYPVTFAVTVTYALVELLLSLLSGFGGGAAPGGILYLITFTFPKLGSYGIGNYAQYFSYLASASEYVHIIVSIAAFVLATVIIALVWGKLISKRLKLENPIPRRELLSTGLWLGLLFSFALWMQLNVGVISLAAIIYGLYEYRKARAK